MIQDTVNIWLAFLFFALKEFEDFLPESWVEEGGCLLKLKGASSKPPEPHKRVQLVSPSLAVCLACQTNADLLTQGASPFLSWKELFRPREGSRGVSAEIDRSEFQASRPPQL